MTIDEAIKHCLEVAECNEIAGLESEARRQCCNDHRQLAEWRTELKELEAKHWDECRQIAHYDDELKELREENKVLISECDRLIKEKGELLKKSEHIAEYKRLLNAAVEDVETLAKAFTEDEPCGSFTLCSECPLCVREGCSCKVWRYKAEALKLIGGETDEHHVFIRELMDELKEAKRLLKAAVEDFQTIDKLLIDTMDSSCAMFNHMANNCPNCPMNALDTEGKCKWRYADEALKLIES